MREHTPGEPVHYSPKGGVPYRDGLYVSTTLKGSYVVRDVQTGQEQTIKSDRVKFLDDECEAATGRPARRGVSHFVEPMEFAPIMRPTHPIDAALEAIARAPMRSRPLGKKPPKPVRYEVFKAFVRAKPCRLCGLEGPSDPHHFGPRGVSQKTSDLRLVPLCDSNPATGYEGHHDYFHRTGSLPGMDRVGTEAWINAAILELHDEFFGAWISSGESPDALEERLADALDSAGEEPI